MKGTEPGATRLRPLASACSVAACLGMGSGVVNAAEYPQLHGKFSGAGIDLAATTPKGFGALIRREIPRGAAFAKRSGVSAN
jgi:hypothetical protein